MTTKYGGLNTTEHNTIEAALRVIERNKHDLAHCIAVKAFREGLETFNEVNLEHIMQYGFRLAGIRMCLDYIDWKRITLNDPRQKDAQVYVDAVRRLFTDVPTFEHWLIFGDSGYCNIQYYDFQKDKKGKLISVKAKLVKESKIITEVKV